MRWVSAALPAAMCVRSQPAFLGRDFGLVTQLQFADFRTFSSRSSSVLDFSHHCNREKRSAATPVVHLSRRTCAEPRLKRRGRWGHQRGPSTKPPGTRWFTHVVIARLQQSFIFRCFVRQASIFVHFHFSAGRARPVCPCKARPATAPWPRNTQRSPTSWPPSPSPASSSR